MRRFAVVLLVLSFVFVSCRGPAANQTHGEQKCSLDLSFQVDLNESVYQDTTYGHPPQMAIWLENQEDHSIRTVMVTYRMGACVWNGKVKSDVSLPYWVGFYNRQTGTSGPPTRDHPAPDAVTHATPKAQLVVHASVPRGSRWSYFIEVNVSGDFNAAFPKQSEDGKVDREGNGQPSLVYGGTIEGVHGAVSQPAVLGHTDQYEPVSKLTEGTKGITTALKLFKSVTVSCRQHQ